MRIASALLTLASLSSAEFCQDLCDSYAPCRSAKQGSYAKDDGSCFGLYHKGHGFCFQPGEQDQCDDSVLSPVYLPGQKHAPGKVLILYTGGTLGMKPYPNGTLHPEPGYLTEQLAHIDELNQPGMPEFSVLEWEDIIDSSDMSPAAWSKMATEIEDNYADYDGFVILHGTDTMSYTASALSYMLENLSKSVIVTGAILPFIEPHSDARRNIVMSIMMAGFYSIPEVTIYFDTKILRGVRSTKIDSGAIEAFASPKSLALADVGVGIDFAESEFLGAPTGPLSVSRVMENDILMVHMVPGFPSLLSLDLSAVKGVVVLLYGSGNAPSNNADLTKWFQKLQEASIPVVGVSQVLRGVVDMGDYAAGSQLVSLGVIGAADMTPEASYTKLAYFLGKGDSLEDIKEKFATNIRGELTENNMAAVDPFRDLIYPGTSSSLRGSTRGLSTIVQSIINA